MFQDYKIILIHLYGGIFIKAWYKEKIKKRNFIKSLESMAKVEKYVDDFKFLPEGLKVKINYEEITSRPTYNRMRQEYRDFVEKNKNEIFTVEYDDKHKEKPYLVCFKEDDTPLKWLWEISSDLIVVDDNTEE
jgi:hypothetical protein